MLLLEMHACCPAIVSDGPSGGDLFDPEGCPDCQLIPAKEEAVHQT